MAFQVRVTEIANDDLAAHVRFIARDNLPAAERFGIALIEKLKSLQAQTLLGRVVPERADPGLREIIHRPYRSVYRVSEQRKMVEVLRFCHGARGEPELGK